MKTVVFVCAHNSGRSQMAEAFFNQMHRAGHKQSRPDHQIIKSDYSIRHASTDNQNSFSSNGILSPT